MVIPSGQDGVFIRFHLRCHLINTPSCPLGITTVYLVKKTVINVVYSKVLKVICAAKVQMCFYMVLADICYSCELFTSRMGGASS